jgi:hypothetical protein
MLSENMSICGLYKKKKITGLFTLQESRGYRISCVVKGLQ